MLRVFEQALGKFQSVLFKIDPFLGQLVEIAPPADSNCIFQALPLLFDVFLKQVEVKRTVPRDEGQGGSRGVSRTKKIFVGGIPLTLIEGRKQCHFLILYSMDESGYTVITHDDASFNYDLQMR